MLKEWIMPKWMKKYRYFIDSSKVTLSKTKHCYSIKEIKDLVDGSLDKEKYTVMDYVENERVIAQIKLLENLHERGIIQ